MLLSNGEVAIIKLSLFKKLQTTAVIYHIVGAAGADIFRCKISNESPIVQAFDR